MVSEKDDDRVLFFLCKIIYEPFGRLVGQLHERQVGGEDFGIGAVHRDVWRKVVVICPVVIGGVVLHRDVE